MKIVDQSKPVDSTLLQVTPMNQPAGQDWIALAGGLAGSHCSWLWPLCHLPLHIASGLREVECVEQIVERWTVRRHVGIAGGGNRIREVVPAPAGDGLQVPVSVDE